MAHLYIAAAHKSSGKTTVSVGLTAALVKKGLAVQPFKKGPDYIDPLWLSRAAGRPCYNLDFFTQTHKEIAATFAGNLNGADIGLIEGNKGLFDGVDVEGTDSNAALATMLTAPVVLVIDTGGMTRGIAPLIRGYLDFDPEVHIGGVILNKVGGARHEAKLRAALERYTDAEVLGAIGRDAALEIPERHLGLIPANEASGPAAADTMISRLANSISAGIDLNRVIEIARATSLPAGMKGALSLSRTSGNEPDVRIAIARDAAFGFYYPDDLDAFERAGAELIPFDTLRDEHLPEADGLFIGGGFPETQLEALSANQSLLTDIRQALAAGMPAYAECGGLMYLSRNIQWRGEQRDMVGTVPADVLVGKRPQGRGYMVVEDSGKHPWPHTLSRNTGGIPAHEFHYARLENLSEDRVFAHRVLRGTGIDGNHDGLVINNLLAGFAHHRNTAANPWVERFVEFVREISAKK
jgi:cobyrinic acid a,c-diamide synthase